MQALLRVIQKQANLQQIRLLPETVIGRSADCNLKIASTQVSRRHCRIVVNDVGVYVEDLCSANGTFLEGQRLLPNQLTLASPGAKLSIGPATFVVEYRPPVVLRPEVGAAPTASAQATMMDTTEDTAAITRTEFGATSGRQREPSVVPAPLEAASAFPPLETDPPKPNVDVSPTAEPPKRARSLFGLFRRGEKAAEKPVVPGPVLSAEVSAGSIEHPAGETPAPAAGLGEFPFAPDVKPDDEENPFRQFSKY